MSQLRICPTSTLLQPIWNILTKTELRPLTNWIMRKNSLKIELSHFGSNIERFTNNIYYKLSVTRKS